MEYVLGPGLYQWRGGHLVRLKEKYRNCVVLIGTGGPRSGDKIEPWGTAFIVECGAPRGTYIVTAAHVVAQNIGAPFEIRFNERGGGARNVSIETPHWIFHPTDNTVDVAVHEIELPQWADVAVIPKTPNLMLGDRMDLKDIGAGNRTYTVGLWKFLHGTRRNQTFVYTGHVGLIPDGEKIPVMPWLPDHEGRRVFVDAYLVEGEPINGASGSPVFVRRTIPIKVKPDDAEKPVNAAIEGSVWLLGLQSDAFVGVPGEDYEIPLAGGNVVVPRGVNVVVPLEKILEVIDQPKLLAVREGALAMEEDAKLPVKTARVPPTTADNPRHREDFSRALNAAVSRRKPDRGT